MSCSLFDRASSDPRASGCVAPEVISYVTDLGSRFRPRLMRRVEGGYSRMAIWTI